MRATGKCGALPGVGALGLAGLALIGLWGCSSREDPTASHGLEYTSGLTLSVHLPSPSEALLPIVVLLHGAGLSSEDYVSFADQIAASGAVVLNADWSVLGPSRESALEEIACLVRFARDRAADFEGDPDRVVLVGHSAATAYVGFVATNGDTVANTCDFDTSPLPNGLALLAPATLPGGGPLPYSSFDGNPELRVAVVHGSDDRVASAGRSERMAEVWEDAGYQTDFRRVPGGHYDLVGVHTAAGPTTTTSPLDESAAATTISMILDLVSDQGTKG